MKRNSVRPAAVVLAAALLGAAVPAVAQGQEPAVTQPKVNLTLEQRFVIKELLKDLKVTPAPPNSETAIGATVPATISLNPMPADVAAKVPQIKSHLFYLADGKVVIVDPKENKIVDAFN
ncbi:MAG TPA: DUF1236 domain-containing protein [Xanthobacteraceae bacterium]